MKYLLCLVAVCLLVGCQCKKYLNPFNMNKPILESGRVYIDLYDDYRFRVGAVAQGVPNTITLPNDSSIYVIGIDFTDDDSTIIVQEGSEFYYVQNKYRVRKVIPKFIMGDGRLQNISQGIYLQLLETPKYCKCQNKKLKAFDEQLKYMDIDSLLAE
jgi:hypothetical protein